MAARSGLQTFLNLSHRFCRLFGTYRGSIVDAINASSADSGTKTQLLLLVSTIDTSCAAVEVLRVTWES